MLTTPPAPQLSECRKWLRVELGAPHSVKSWAVLGGGTSEATTVVWRHVKDSDLGPQINPKEFLTRQIEIHYGSSLTLHPPVGFLTGVFLERYVASFLVLSGIWV